MTDKPEKKQAVKRRAPTQARALHKVGLILEASMRLIDQGGLDALTTNAIAERAGVSIGTVYQYFKDKQAILDRLTQQELEGMSTRVMAVLQGPAPREAGGRVRAVVHAVLATYGGRRRVHRLLLEHALARGPVGGRGKRLNPMLAGIVELFGSSGVPAQGDAPVLSRAQAFVLTHAVGGVLRALVAQGERALERQAVEDALVQLILGYAAQIGWEG